MKLNELENVLLDQIEKLNDDSIGEKDADMVRAMVEKSKAISDLSKNVMELNRFKLDVVKHCEMNGSLYEEYLGIEEKPKTTAKRKAIQ